MPITWLSAILLCWKNEEPQGLYAIALRNLQNGFLRNLRPQWSYGGFRYLNDNLILDLRLFLVLSAVRLVEKLTYFAGVSVGFVRMNDLTIDAYVCFLPCRRLSLQASLGNWWSHICMACSPNTAKVRNGLYHVLRYWLFCHQFQCLRWQQSTYNSVTMICFFFALKGSPLFWCVCDFSKIALIKSRFCWMLFTNHVIVAMETQFQRPNVMVLLIRVFVMHNLR